MNQRLLFLGPPGAGKGTQAEILCKSIDLLHLSTGDLLRTEVAAATKLGQEVAVVMNKGELVSDDMVLSLVESRLTGIAKGWLLDGFPRNVEQAEALEMLLVKLSQPISTVILLELTDELIIERLLSRGREDDNEVVIRRRLDVYREKTEPLVTYYKKKGLVKSVPAQGSIDDIALGIEKALS